VAYEKCTFSKSGTAIGNKLLKTTIETQLALAHKVVYPRPPVCISRAAEPVAKYPRP